MVRYRFSEFTLSPQRRLLVRGGREVPLIPRYFDLLLLLIERRREAVHRREIFERVWTDAVVSDSALSQAVRTIRSTLGDDSRDPRFIRTVSRHGYQFVFPEVIEEEDTTDRLASATTSPTTLTSVEPLAERVAPPSASTEGTEERDKAGRFDATRWTRASVGAALAGMATGVVGGFILVAAPGSTAPIDIVPVLAVIGGLCGAVGGAGVGAGLTLAHTTGRSHRAFGWTMAGGLGGGLVGTAVQWLSRWGLAALLGFDLDVGGALEGVAIGGAAGFGVATATRSTEDGLLAPRGNRVRAILITALCCGLAALALTLAGRPLVSGTIHALATAADGSRATLVPLARLVGEPDFGPVSAGILAFVEGAMFGLGLALGLLRTRVPPGHYGFRRRPPVSPSRVGGATDRTAPN